MRPKGVIDGKQVNIPAPGGSDEGQSLFELIGLFGRAMHFQEITPPYSPYPKPTQVVR